MLKNLLKKQPEPAPKLGKLIVIDGPNGKIKDDQIKLLAKTLEVSGYSGAIVNFPDPDKLSAQLLQKYIDGEFGELTPEAASILYATNRLESSSEIKELLDNGLIVIADRYVTSNAGFQGMRITDEYERTKFYRWLNNLEYGTFKIPKPNLNILLYSGTDDALDKQVYLEIAELFPNTFLVECTEDGKGLTESEIHAKVWEIVRRMALKDIEPALNAQ